MLTVAALSLMDMVDKTICLNLIEAFCLLLMSLKLMVSNHLPTELTIVYLLGILSFLLVIYFTHHALF